MIKAVITGFFTGIIISGLLICATFVRTWLPNTFTANLFFLASFFLGVSGVLWLALNYYCRSSEVKWMTLGATGILSSLFAAIIVYASAGPIGFNKYNFLDLALALLVISVVIAGIYYIRNRNRVLDDTHKNQELIF